jgi:hypothetical protein
MTRVPPIAITETFNPGGARLCEEHGGRAECTKNRSRGRGPCHGNAIRGTAACKTHAGVSLAVAQAKGEARITAWSALGSHEGNVDYRMAVLGVLQMSWLRLAAYSDLLRRQVVSQDKEPDIDGLGPGDHVQASGLIGHRYGSAGSEGNIYAVGEEVRALVALEAAERDRVVKIAKTAHDMGISDRLTNLAERWGDLVATRITLMLDELSLSPEQSEKVPHLIQAHLGSIDMGSMGASES